MKEIANLLFEVRILKDIVRSGYAFLGTGRETIAEHSFMTAVICLVMSKIENQIDTAKLLSMALIHDVPEARTGDFNYVEKKYSRVNEEKAVDDMVRQLEFGDDIKALVEEFNMGESREAMLANDADQISFVLELKKQQDIGAKGPERWLPYVLDRLKTDTGRKIADAVMATTWDEWWAQNYSE